jgi:NitT/TauT family transport system substrate-binding protein
MMGLNLKILRKVIQMILVGLVLWTVAAPTWAQDKISISISALAPSVASLWVPYEEGFFKKHGLNAELILIESGSLTSQALAAGEIGIAHNAGAPAIIANASGSGETIIMGLINVLEYSLVGTAKLKGIEDLKGKRIGVSRIGSSSHAAVAIALDHFKMDPSKDNITFIQSGTMTTRVSGLKAGSIDATVVDPSFVPFLKREGFKDLGYLGELGIPYEHEVLVSTRFYLKQHRDRVLKAVKAVIEGIAFTAQERNAPEVKRVLSKYLKFDAAKTEDAYKAVKSYAIRSRKPYPTVEGVNALIRFFARYNQAVAKITPANVIDSTLVEELDKSGFIDALYK